MTPNPNMDTTELTYKDIGQLLEAKGEELQSDPEDPEQVIREVMDTLGRAAGVRNRHKKVGVNGTISVGRDLSGEYGAVIFQPDSELTGEGEPEGGD